MRHMPSYCCRRAVLLAVLLSCTPLGAQPQTIHVRKKFHNDSRLGVKSQDFIQPSNTSFPNLTYQGGPLVAHAAYWMVYWGPYWTSGLGLAQRQHFTGFVKAVAPSSGFTGLFAEYQKPAYPILAGSFAGEILISTGPGTSIDDSAITTQISDWITSKVLPVPDANTVFVMMFPAGADVTQGGQSACQYFLGYHSDATSPAGTFGYYRYIVMPYQNCGADLAEDSPVTVNGMTDTLGHEMSEVETDPDSSPLGLGWYDNPNNEEIADICADTSANIGYLNFWMQKVWSNAASTCIGPVSGSASIHLTISALSNGEPSGAANILPGFPTTFTISTDSPTPVSLSLSALPLGVTYNLSQPTVSATSTATLQISTNASPGASGTATVTATLNSQQAQFQFLVVPWQQVSTVNVTHTNFVYTASLNGYAGTITLQNTGTQPIGPTLLLGYHGLDSRIFPATEGQGTATAPNQAGPNGDYAAQFPDGMLAPGSSVSTNVVFTNQHGLPINFTPQIFQIQSGTVCDPSGAGFTNVADVQLIINEALGTSHAANDLNGDGVVNVVDVQIVVNSDLNLGCSSTPAG